MDRSGLSLPALSLGEFDEGLLSMIWMLRRRFVTLQSAWIDLGWEMQRVRPSSVLRDGDQIVINFAKFSLSAECLRADASMERWTTEKLVSKRRYTEEFNAGRVKLRNLLDKVSRPAGQACHY
ncbi:hypothetical protein VL15_34365 [Burkholderia cepacia]|uniref:Uncharacterized protein n=1 Tax=Burkholderia cepacia TaxID=292 RepID=A0A0J5WIP1_BURCE|nr:hypothetical protein VL15_34365 [Burkholderia cepacia]